MFSPEVLARWAADGGETLEHLLGIAFMLGATVGGLVCGLMARWSARSRVGLELQAARAEVAWLRFWGAELVKAMERKAPGLREALGLEDMPIEEG